MAIQSAGRHREIPGDDWPGRMRQAAEDCERKRRAWREAKGRRDELVAEGRRLGHPVREVAELGLVSMSRVVQIEASVLGRPEAQSA